MGQSPQRISMKNHIFLFAIFILMFVGNNILYQVIGTPTSVFTTILPSCYIITFVLLQNRCKPLEKGCKKKEELFLFVCWFLLLAMQLAMKSSGFLGNLIDMLFLPITISYLYPENNEDFKTKVRKIIILFYCIDSIWSIGERIIGKNIFPFTGNIEEENIIYSLEGFRSSALQDHPLNNALCLTAIIVFVLTSSYITLKKKLFLFFVGYMAILCFNTRSSMILWAIIMIIFLIHFIFFTKKNVTFIIKLRFSIFILLLIPIIFSLINHYNLGDRLTSQKLLDDSALVRILSLEMFLNSDFMSIFVGIPSEKIELLMYKSQILIIENFWIIYFLKYGIIGFVLLLLGFYKLLKRIFKPYTKYRKIFCIVFFFLLASTNNSLAVYTTPLCLFILCGYSFSEKGRKHPKLDIYRRDLSTSRIHEGS